MGYEWDPYVDRRRIRRRVTAVSAAYLGTVLVVFGVLVWTQIDMRDPTTPDTQRFAKSQARRVGQERKSVTRLRQGARASPLLMAF